MANDVTTGEACAEKKTGDTGSQRGRGGKGVVRRRRRERGGGGRGRRQPDLLHDTLLVVDLVSGGSASAPLRVISPRT